MIIQPVLKTTVADISRMFLVNMRFALATDLLTLLIIISSQLTDDKKVTKRSESFFSSIKSKTIFVLYAVIGTFVQLLPYHTLKALTAFTLRI